MYCPELRSPVPIKFKTFFPAESNHTPPVQFVQKKKKSEMLFSRSSDRHTNMATKTVVRQNKSSEQVTTSDVCQQGEPQHNANLTSL